MVSTPTRAAVTMRLRCMGTASLMRFEEPLNSAGAAFSVIRGQTGHMRILVVEDDELTASALERGLAAEGYAVEVASDGIDGLHRAKEFA